LLILFFFHLFILVFIFIAFFFLFLFLLLLLFILLVFLLLIFFFFCDLLCCGIFFGVLGDLGFAACAACRVALVFVDKRAPAYLKLISFALTVTAVVLWDLSEGLAADLAEVCRGI
jgi:hypothetical protein